jgi:very-short-patch-repair endonuclease
MNPLHIARNLREDYLLLLRTTFNPRQERLREAFLREVERDGFLTREPFVSLAQPYKYAEPLTSLTEETRRRFGEIAERPYAHQAGACQRILEGQPTVIATGTGSGKTEAFLMPIADHCLRHKGEPGPKAILMYPMNALANDQLRRIRERLAGSGVSFGRYTGETQLRGERPADAPEEERCTRAEFRANPPDIILTNYQMLEYMLLRGDGRDIFRDHRVRFVVLDEVHTYHGALGSDVACLMRRLRSALGAGRPNDPPPLFIGTSATLHAGIEGGDPRDGIAAFFTRLTGQQTDADAVIMEEPDIPQRPEGLAWPPAPDIPRELLDKFGPDDRAAVLGLARLLAGRPEDTISSLGELWSRTPLPYVLTSWLREPLSVDEIVKRLSEEPGRNGVSRDQLMREIEAALLVGPCLPDEHPLRLRPRVHRFLRGLVPFWRCTNPECGRLVGERVERCEACGARTLPLALCRTCGWDFFMARSGGETLAGELVTAWPHRVSTKDTVFLYDPPTERPELGDEEDIVDFESAEPEEATEDGVAAAEAGETDEAEPEDTRLYLCPNCLVLSPSAGERACGCSGEKPVRPVLAYRRRGTKCPVCEDTYGRFDILTPVSLGNSSALSHVSRTLIRELPEDRRKLLVFCDSRQDAAHQARFIQSVEGYLLLRRGVYTLLSSDGEPHDLHWLVDNLYHDRVERGFLPRTRSRDAQEREKAKIEGELLTEFAIFTKVRAGLERLGLVRVRYAELEEELRGNDFENICTDHGLNPSLVRRAVPALLDYMRTRRALAHEALQHRLRRGDRLSDRYGLQPGPVVGFPIAFRLPGQRADKTNTYSLTPTWSAGGRCSVQRLMRQLVGDDVTEHAMGAIFEWMLDQGYLQEVRVGKDGDEASGLQVSLDNVLFEVARNYARCSICGRVAGNEPGGGRCFRVGCEGRFEEWEGPLAANNLEALVVATEYAPPLIPAEHSAAITDDRRQEIEAKFTSVPPQYNVLACTPTLELGVNIGELEAVAMRNIPPNPAHYAQRAGRTGRQTRMGVVAGFARNTPHDGYFFDHPDEVIAGSIPPPRFNMNNLEAVARHVRSLAVEEARADFPSDLQPYMSEEGGLNEAKVREIVRQVSDARGAARDRAIAMFGDVIPGERWVDDILEAFPQELEAALQRRAAFIEEAVRRMRELAVKVRPTFAEERAVTGYRDLANRLRTDYRYAYLPRVLAEEGLLPGYAFPGDPGSLSLGFDPEPVFAGRLQAQREYAPGQVVYLRGQRWRVRGVALHRPGATRTRGRNEFEFTECPSCGLANPARGRNTCLRCRAELGGPTLLAWDAGAFQATPEEVEPQAEEERLIRGFDVRPHPQRDVSGAGYAVGPWRLSLRHQETIWWINHGRPSDDGDEATGEGFRLCRSCGQMLGEASVGGSQPTAQGGRVRRRDPQARRDEHLERCGGTPETLCIGHEFKADTLRLFVPGLAGIGSEGVDWAISLGYAILRGAIRVFDIDEYDLEPVVLVTRRDGIEAAAEILWVDTVLGGSGILEELVGHFPKVAAAAVEHLAGHDCSRSCYRCLRSYYNQRFHHRLNWRLVVRQLEGVAQEAVETLAEDPDAAPATEGPEWDEARAEGCGSPLELVLLRAMRDAGLPEPAKQYEVRNLQGVLLTKADFAYPDDRLLIYVDGLAFHSALSQRLHDTRQTNELQMMGYHVLRFLGPEVHRGKQRCIDQIRAALAKA